VVEGVVPSSGSVALQTKWIHDKVLSGGEGGGLGDVPRDWEQIARERERETTTTTYSLSRTTTNSRSQICKRSWHVGEKPTTDFVFLFMTSQSD